MKLVFYKSWIVKLFMRDWLKLILYETLSIQCAMNFFVSDLWNAWVIHLGAKSKLSFLLFLSNSNFDLLHIHKIFYYKA